MKRDYIKYLIVILLFKVLLFLPLVAYSENINEDSVNLFVEANKYYAEGSYDLALNNYLKIVKAGIKSSGLFYNIGNSYVRIGKTGYAILYYEKARILSPRDSAVLENLCYARERIVDKIDVKEGITLRELLIIPKYMNLYDSWIFFLISFIVFWIFISLRIFFRKRIINLSIVAFLLIFIFSSASFYSVWSDGNLETKAVFVDDETDVRSGNDLKSATLFKLHEGSTVKALSKNGKWIKIELADGRKGWVSEFALRIID